MRRGRKALVIAKFLPGFSTVVPPLAGMVGIARSQFIVLDIAAAILWAGTWMGVGYPFSDALELVASWVASLGNFVVVIIAAALASYVVSSSCSAGGFSAASGSRGSRPKSSSGASIAAMTLSPSSTPARRWT
jgi:hypothetical protein